MARYSEHDVSEIYVAAERFRNECLLRDDSLFFDGKSLWTSQNLEQLHRVFNASPDTGDRKFIDKFRDQIKPSGVSTALLAAEIVAVYLLFPTSIGRDKKREVVGEVLSWGNEKLPSEHVVTSAFGSGIGSGGQGYNTRRPNEIAFLIEFGIAWKKLDEQQRAATLANPWSFKDILDGIKGADSRQLRHMLLHMLFPDTFERIASGGHKERVRNAFGQLAPDPGDEDRHLLAIRGELEKLLGIKKLDFYWPPLISAWYDNFYADDTELTPLDLLRHKKQIVMFGPPGTGKTFRAKQLAERIIRTAALERMKPARYFKEQAVVDKALKNNIHRLQLHPAYGYEDFIRGLHLGSDGQTEYRLGYLPTLVNAITSAVEETNLPHVLILDEINRTDLSRMLGECFSLLEDREQPVELPGRDRSGATMTLRIPDDLYVIGTMNLIDQSIEQVDFALRRRFLWLACPFSADDLLAASRARWVSDTPWEHVEDEFRTLATAATRLNDEIHRSAHLGPAYEIGHTYFLDVGAFLSKALSQRTRQPKYFLWKRGAALAPVADVWRLSLRPLLEQYLAGLDAVARDKELTRLEATFLKSSDSE